MKKWNLSIVYSTILILSANIAVAQDIHYVTEDAEIIIPESSQIKKSNERLARTNLIVTKPKKKLANGLPYGETPASLACVYGLTTPVPGCNIYTATALPTGGWGAIALVDAYYNPYAENDLNTYSTQFGLPACTTANGCFNLYYATGGSCNKVTPPAKQGWWDEQVIDIQMAHAMAPQAKIYLVEAETESFRDLFAAVDCASSLVAAAGGGLVSSSWGAAELRSDIRSNSHFKTPGVVYIASSGDNGAPGIYPSYSPYVVSAGGTTIKRDQNGNFISEEAWNESGGGPSLYQPRPSYQAILRKIVGIKRGTPDIAFDANPNTGVLVYSTYEGGWVVDGGTSVASPALAGILNSANKRFHSTHQQLTYIYKFYPKKYREYWHDIIKGNNGYPTMAGYDFVTGLGTPRGYAGK